VSRGVLESGFGILNRIWSSLKIRIILAIIRIRGRQVGCRVV
jgi:hypothetical protein